ncbi:MAG: glutamine amidotransferase-related protein [Calditrichia bacterium]
MITPAKKDIKLAIIDLYDNEPNEGMRCIQEIVENCSDSLPDQKIDYSVYETRYKDDIPTLNNDIYISSGGPGSPFDGEGKRWESHYFNLIDHIWNHNQTHENKKHVFFICHSFQMMCRFFELADIQERQFRSFGIIPVAKTDKGMNDPLLTTLPEPYFAADFRQYEVVDPREAQFKQLDASLLSKEFERIDPTQPKAMMTIRLSDTMFATQYHPEADPDSMNHHFRKAERRQQVVEEYGEERYNKMIALLDRPDTIRKTRSSILPQFINSAVAAVNEWQN